MRFALPQHRPLFDLWAVFLGLLSCWPLRMAEISKPGKALPHPSRGICVLCSTESPPHSIRRAAVLPGRPWVAVPCGILGKATALQNRVCTAVELPVVWNPEEGSVSLDEDHVLRGVVCRPQRGGCRHGSRPHSGSFNTGNVPRVLMHFWKHKCLLKRLNEKPHWREQMGTGEATRSRVAVGTSMGGVVGRREAWSAFREIVPRMFSHQKL